MMSALNICSGPQVSLTVRKATMKTHVPSLKQILVAISWKWICPYVAKNISAVPDSYIAGYVPNSLEIRLLGVEGEHQECQGIDIANVLQRSSVNEYCYGKAAGNAIRFKRNTFNQGTKLVQQQKRGFSFSSVFAHCIPRWKLFIQ